MNIQKDMFKEQERDDALKNEALWELKHLKLIQKELADLGVHMMAKIHEPKNCHGRYKYTARLTFENGKIYSGLEFVEQYNSSAFYARPTGCFNIRLCDYSNRTKTYRKLKAGGYNYKAIAQEINSRLIAAQERDAIHNQEQENRVLCKHTREELGLGKWGAMQGFSIEPTQSADEPLKIMYQMTVRGDAEKAKAVLAQLKKAGLID